MCVRDVIFLFFFSFGVHGESVGSEVDAASAADGLSAASVRGDDGRRDSSVRFGFVFKSFPKKKKRKRKVSVVFDCLPTEFHRRDAPDLKKKKKKKKEKEKTHPLISTTGVDSFFATLRSDGQVRRNLFIFASISMLFRQTIGCT